MKIQKSKIKFRDSKTKFRKQENKIQKQQNKIQETGKIKLGAPTTKNDTRKSPKMRPENHQNMVPKHKNYDPKLPQDQAEKSQIPQKTREKRSKTGSKHAANQTKKLRKIQK